MFSSSFLFYVGFLMLKTYIKLKARIISPANNVRH